MISLIPDEIETVVSDLLDSEMETAELYSDPETILEGEELIEAPGDDELTALTVSDGDAVPVVAEFTADLGTTNFLLSALLFFTIFEWVERRLLHAVRKGVFDE